MNSIALRAPERALDFLDQRQKFLSWFPRRDAFIWKTYDQERWQKATGPLLDAQILGVVSDDGRGLFRGCYWSHKTRHAVLDIDAKSKYHNAADLQKLQAQLSAVGLYAISYRSSDSGGWHLYLPFEEWAESDEVNQTLKTWLKSLGYEIASGQLEIFPSGNALRLPLQKGFAWLAPDGSIKVRREEIREDEALASFLQDFEGNSRNWQEAKRLIASQIQSAGSRAGAGVQEHEKVIALAGFDDLFRKGKIQEKWDKGRDYWFHGLIGKNQRHDAIQAVGHYLWYGDPSENVPAYPGRRHNETRARLIEAWLRKKHNGLCNHINRGQWALIEADIWRAVFWRRQQGYQAYSAYPLTDRLLKRLLEVYNKTGKLFEIDRMAEANNKRQEDARCRIAMAVAAIQKDGVVLTKSEVARRAGANRVTVVKHSDLLTNWPGVNSRGVWGVSLPLGGCNEPVADLTSILTALEIGFEEKEKSEHPLCSDSDLGDLETAQLDWGVSSNERKRRETGKEQWMKEPYAEGLANHSDRESCAGTREDAREALTAACTGWVLSPEKLHRTERRRSFHSRKATSEISIREISKSSAWSETPYMYRNSMHGNRESPGPTLTDREGPQRKSKRSKPMMNGRGQSDSGVVPEKSANKVGLSNSTAAEQMEGSALTKGNEKQRNTLQTQGWESVCNELQLVHQRAKEDKRRRFTALLHHIYNIEALKMAFFKLKKNAASGVDKETWQSYGEKLEQNIQNLSERLKGGAYRAKPVRRVYIPKPNGHQRPLGVTALEDKVVQRATVEVLNAVYEADFIGYSYGFRPGRSQHKALDALHVGLMTRKVNWVLDADIRDFYGSINHEWLTKFVEHRIADKRVVRLIQKWLNAGVLEDGQVTYDEVGAPQGASASPLLSNVYLHYVYDLWVQQWRQKHAHGDVIVVRFADDTIVGFQHKSDAERFLKDLKERFLKFGLELHPEKTRLIEFGRFAAKRREERGEGKPETFTFLGFTHICGKTRTGKFTVMRQTIRKRLRAKVKALRDELSKRMHEPIREVGKWLNKVLAGHYQYYGVPGNYAALSLFRYRVYWTWRHALMRRSQKGYVTWKKMNAIIDRWLPKPHICHPHPLERFGVRTQGRSLVR